jgi:hypothetical protein
MGPVFYKWRSTKRREYGKGQKKQGRMCMNKTNESVMEITKKASYKHKRNLANNTGGGGDKTNHGC